ncbi:MAG TPA: zf-HC2 domain-containing protein [Thermoanaerobaculia bacterium]|jgi:hypothetical protein|nr:zf-HC2 domain-containing protein [Thermoanaerobaculia bacterium]
MNDDSDGVVRSLRELASEARQRQGTGAHPSPETLTSYHRGELTPAAEDDVQEHLAVCRHCARLVLDLPAFQEAPDPADPGLGGLDAEAEASWQTIRARLPGPSTPAGRHRDASSARRFAWLQPFTPLAAAAVLAGATVVAVPLWIIARQLTSPELPPETLELSTPEGQRGPGEAPAAPAIVHAQAASTTLLLRLTRPQPDLRFRIELLAGNAAGGSGAAGAPAGHTLPLPAVKVVDSRTLVLVLARRQLAPGRYQLRVLDAQQPAADPLGDYQLAVVEP